MQNALPSEVMLVLGMHRSGTSATSRIFSLLGFSAPKTLIGVNDANVTGHWESTPFARLNDEIMQSANLVWSDWRSGNVLSMRSKARERFETDIINTLSTEFPHDRPIVLKDPRICRVFALYKTALTARDIPVRIVTPIRNPLAVIESLKARNGMSETDASLLWLRHMLDAVHAGEGLSRAFFRYEKLLEHPIATIRTMLETLDLSPPYALESVEDEILDFLQSDLNHHEFSTGDVVHSPHTSGWVSEAYEALLVLSNDPYAKTALKRLAAIREDLDQANGILNMVSSGFRQHFDQQSNEINNLKSDLETRLIANQDLRTEKEELANLLSVSQHELEEAKKHVGQLSSERDILSTERDALSSERDAYRDRAESTESQLAAALAESGEWQRRFTILQSAHTKSETELQTLGLRAKATEKELRQLQRQFWRLKDELSWSKEIIQGYESSTSWKVSAPVRAVARLGRRLKASVVRAPAPGTSANSSLEPPAEEKEPGHSASPSKQTVQANGPAAHDPAKLIKEIGLLEQSPSFDKAYYLAMHPESATHPHGAEGHYLSEGWKRGYRPNPTFETNAYLAAHPELVGTDTCPLVHYIKSSGDMPVRDQSGLNGSAHSHDEKGVGRVAVFTAISNGYDDLKEPEAVSANTDYFVFTDADMPAHSKWTALPFEYLSHDPTRTARFIKTHPHLYFKDYDWAIWIDANLQLAAPAEQLLPDGPRTADFYTWRHPLRNCVYEEADECILRNKDERAVIMDQIESLRTRQFPKQYGLFETSVLVSKMGVNAVEQMYNLWWSEICKWSKRDQISLPFVVRSTGIEVGALARKKICMRTDPRFIYYRHARR